MTEAMRRMAAKLQDLKSKSSPKSSAETAESKHDTAPLPVPVSIEQSRVPNEKDSITSPSPSVSKTKSVDKFEEMKLNLAKKREQKRGGSHILQGSPANSPALSADKNSPSVPVTKKRSKSSATPVDRSVWTTPKPETPVTPASQTTFASDVTTPLSTEEKRGNLNRTKSVDKFQEMKLNLTRMRDEKRGVTTTPGDSEKKSLEPTVTPLHKSSETVNKPKFANFLESPTSDGAKAAKAEQTKFADPEPEENDRGRTMDRERPAPGKRLKRSSSVQKWNELKSRTEQMRNNKEEQRQAVGASEKRLENENAIKSTFSSADQNMGDRMASGKKTLEEMKRRTAARRQRKEEAKREKVAALDGKVETMLKGIVSTIQAFEREKEKATSRIKALESENSTLHRKINDQKYNQNLFDARDGLANVLENPEVPSEVLEQITQIKLLIEAATGDFQAERLVTEKFARVKRENSSTPSPRIIETVEGVPPPPPPPPPALSVGLPSSTLKIPAAKGAPAPRPVISSVSSLLQSIQHGTKLRKVDHEQVQKEREETSDNIFKSLEDTMKMALGIRRAVMDTQDSDDSDSDSDDWFSD